MNIHTLEMRICDRVRANANERPSKAVHTIAGLANQLALMLDLVRHLHVIQLLDGSG